MASPDSLWFRLLDLRTRRRFGSASGTGETAASGVLDRDDRFTITHFSRLLSRHGQTHASLEWRSRESQERRFGVLREAGIRDGQSVLDVGCGTGDLLDWMRRHGVTPGDYLGLDITPAMVEHARARFPDHRFQQGCLLSGPDLPRESYDWVVASGIFAHRYERPEAYMRQMVEAMVARATCGVAVNSLSRKAPNAAQWTMFHADPEETLAWAKTIVPVAMLREDYDPHDFTLYLYRTAAAARTMTWRP
ncbi:class I SAM-dependent methyltransferase [Roseospira visakhapatnamensis]|uniref:SAM-dependent methyltransferase n=1 Tax=Roseospira visakhapatnamensis TaxID=390880 RepID=A0A7W6RCM6_9PROT|nr:class I SAM-dependent methyltransferase [Roseospira visakhapatnamensis]MBB4265544.1 SAM-dependent methyltransferase [Roseospira visakhapatnamensis]